MEILLLCPPFIAPLLPPLGLVSLKVYAAKFGFNCKIIDMNTDNRFWNHQNNYIKSIWKRLRESDLHSQMVIYNVLNIHSSSLINTQDSKKRKKLLKHVLEKNFLPNDDDLIIDLDKSLEEFFHLLDRYISTEISINNYKYIGMGLIETNYIAALYMLKRIKQINKNIKTMIGGGLFSDFFHIESNNFKILSNLPYIDKIVVGEGEIIFTEILKGQFADKKVITLQDIDYQTVDLDEMNYLDFSDLNIKKYLNIGSYTTRGCPFKCTFCSESYYWYKYRIRSAQKSVDEMVYLKNTYGRSNFFLGDSLINSSINPLVKELEQKKETIIFDAYLRSEHNVTEVANTDYWARHGFVRARLGVESASQHVLDLMKKKMTISKITGALKSLSEAGIRTTTYWVIGYPGENDQDFNETLKFLEDNKEYIYEADPHPYYFYPSGQHGSKEFIKSGYRNLYDEEFNDILVFEYLKQGTENPSQQEKFERMHKFTKKLLELNIPNPYSMFEIIAADKRWKNLHPKMRNIYNVNALS